MLTVQASDLYRLVPCKGQIGLTPPGVGAYEDTAPAREGTALHALSNDVLNGRVKHPLDMVDQKISDIYITGAMAEAVAKYTDTLLARGFTGQTEMNLDWQCETALGTIWVLCRSDHCVWDAATGTLYIDDAKFGWRIVEPMKNWALVAYAKGYIARHNITPQRIVLTIIQPRPRHEDGPIRSITMTYSEFLIVEAALVEHLGQLYNVNPLVTGPHCDHCPILGMPCPAAERAGYNAVDVSTDAFNNNITNEEFGNLLDVYERAHDHLGSLIEAYKELGLHRVHQGQIIHTRNGIDYVAERGEGNRRFLPGITPEMIKALTGVDVSVSKTVTPAEAGRRGIHEIVLAAITERPPTGEKLVRRDINKLATKLLNPK